MSRSQWLLIIVRSNRFSTKIWRKVRRWGRSVLDLLPRWKPVHIVYMLTIKITHLLSLQKIQIELWMSLKNWVLWLQNVSKTELSKNSLPRCNVSDNNTTLRSLSCRARKSNCRGQINSWSRINSAWRTKSSCWRWRIFSWSKTKTTWRSWQANRAKRGKELCRGWSRLERKWRGSWPELWVISGPKTHKITILWCKLDN